VSPPLRPRLDAHLVHRGLARSRGHAASLVAAGRVVVAGVPAVRTAARVDDPAQVAVLGNPAGDLASRAGAKLAAGLEEFAGSGLGVGGRDCLDAGASTGGFTDVLLRRGARTVLAVDVGHDQLREHLRTDPRVCARDGLDVRELARRVRPAPATSDPTTPTAATSDPTTPTAVTTGTTTTAATTASMTNAATTNAATTTARTTTGTVRPASDAGDDDLVGRLPAAVVVADLSFISLRAVLPALTVLTAPGGDLLTLVKPQFEVGRQRLPRTGVVVDLHDRTTALVAVAEVAAGLGWGPAGAVASSRPGRTGNVEFVVWWRRDSAPVGRDRWAVLAGAPTADTAPGDTAPGDTAPGDTAPGDTAPGDTAPGETTAPDATLRESAVAARIGGGS